jgi:hypothetical protein
MNASSSQSVLAFDITGCILRYFGVPLGISIDRELLRACCRLDRFAANGDHKAGELGSINLTPARRSSPPLETLFEKGHHGLRAEIG